MSAIINKIINFMTESPIEYITATSVIYKIMENTSMIQKEEMLEISNNAIQTIKNTIDENSDRFRRLNNIPKQVNYQIFKMFLYMLNEDDAISYILNKISKPRKQ